jgi:chemotaxis protein methyltransferase CheR
MNYKLTDTEFTILSDAVALHMGLDFPSQKRDILRHKILPVAKEFGFHTISGFIQWLSSTTLQKDQISILAEHLTVSESYFWREPNVFDAFIENIKKDFYYPGTKKKNINIWCAACSTGEEAYSIAIALHRTIPEIKNWNIKILATDLNKKVLSKAKAGIYTSYSLRNAPPWLKSTYFTKVNNKDYEIIPEIKEMVVFSDFNLTTNNFLSTICKNQKMDIIFCRNVLMYFTKDWADKVSQNIYNALADESWLVVSSCELSSELFNLFTPVNFPGAVLYYKGNEASSNNSIFSEVSVTKPDENIGFISTPARNQELLGFTEVFEIKAFPEQSQAKNEMLIRKNENEESLQKIRIEILNKNKTSIRILADKGHLNEALELCNTAISDEKLAPGLYFLRASILQELDRTDEAIKSLKQAVYIDPDYIMGHFMLGNLFIRKGILKSAQQYFSNARQILNRTSTEDLPEESDGLSARYLLEIIQKSMQIHQIA